MTRCSQCNNKSVIVMPLGKDKRYLCQNHYNAYKRYAYEYFVKFEKPHCAECGKNIDDYNKKKLYGEYVEV